MSHIFPSPQIPQDPNLAAEQAQANAASIRALSQQASSDTAQLMARYGARLALSGATGVSAMNTNTNATSGIFNITGRG